MARQVRQTLPDPPPVYDQQYIASLARSINNFMGQTTALAEVIAARFIMTDPVHIPALPGTPPDGLPNTSKLKLGTIYVKTLTSGEKVLSVVLKVDP